MRQVSRAVVAVAFALQVVPTNAARAQDSVRSRPLLCDGSDAQAAEDRRSRARLMGSASTVISLATPVIILSSRPSRSNARLIGPLLLAGITARAVSMHMLNSTGDQPAAWDYVLERFKVGETRTADVRACLGRPSSLTRQLIGADSTGAFENSAAETWTYVIRRGGIFFTSGSSRTVTITFRGGILTGVRKTETER